jgi:hypothetical protein
MVLFWARILACVAVTRCVSVSIGVSESYATRTVYARLAGGLIDLILEFLFAIAGRAGITKSSDVATGALAHSIG